MHSTAAEPGRVADRGSTQGSGREPVLAGATPAPQRRRRQTGPVQRHFSTGIPVIGKRASGACGNETAHQAQQAGVCVKFVGRMTTGTYAVERSSQNSSQRPLS